MRDAANAILAALDGSAGFGPWLVAEPRAYRWDEMAQALTRQFDRHVRMLHVPRPVVMAAARSAELWARLRGKPPRLDLRRAEDLAVFTYTGDTGPWERALGVSPSVALEDGVADTARWYREQGWLR